MGPARFATALILMLLSCLAYPSKGQTDSLTLVVAIAEAEHIGKYPQALREATRVHQLAVVSSCSSCKVSSFILMGKVHWKDGRYGPSIGYFKKALEFVQSADSGSVKSTIFSYVALNFYYQGYYDSALYYFHKSLDILNNGKDKQKLPKVLNQIAVMYHRKGDYHKSVEYLFEMERVLGESGEDRDVVEVEYWGGMEGLFMDTVYFNEKITETLRQLSYRLAKKETNDLYLIYMNLGRAHDQLNHKLKAARFYKKACDLMEKQNLTPFWNDVGAGYRDANRKDSSFHFYYKYKSKFYSSSTRISQATALQGLGDAHFHFGSYDSALHYYDRAFRLNVEMNNRITVAGLYRRLADTNLKLNRLGEAKSNMLQGLALASEVSQHVRRNLLTSGIHIYQATGEHSKALAFSLRHNSLADSLSVEGTAFNLVRLQANYQAARKDRDLKALQVANVEQQLKLSNRNTFLVSLGAVTFGFLGFIVLLFTQRSKIRKKNLALDAANREQAVLLKEVHHRVKNNLQLVASLINLQSNQVENPETVRELEKTQSRIMSIALIHKKLYQHENVSAIDLRSFLEDLIENILDAFAQDGKVNKVLNIVSLKVDLETAIPMGLIVNELVTNSIKHGLPNAPNPELKVLLVHVNSKLFLTVSDNGTSPMIETSNQDRGFGLGLVKILLERMSGKLKTWTENGTHTHVEITNF